jgi:hypothetical protein
MGEMWTLANKELRKLTEPLRGVVYLSTTVYTSISTNSVEVTLKETFLNNSGLTFYLLPCAVKRTDLLSLSNGT